MSSALLMLVAMSIEAIVGWPTRVYRIVRHPVVWIGALISLLEATFNKPTFSREVRAGFGVMTLVLVVAVSTLCAVAVSEALPDSWAGFVVEALIASSLIATRSLYVHVSAVVKPLLCADISAARLAVGHIVGRDPAQLDAAAVSRGSLESLAENASDGVVAPLFWGVIFGLPGLTAYKAINTLDSMIGHKNPRYQYFGWASAKLDDLVNLLPARLTALCFLVASGRLSAIETVFADACKHRSPNAGWPESALAAGLGVRLSGPRIYSGALNCEPWINGSCPDPDGHAVQQGLRSYVKAMGVVAIALLVLSVVGVSQ